MKEVSSPFLEVLMRWLLGLLPQTTAGKVPPTEDTKRQQREVRERVEDFVHSARDQRFFDPSDIAAMLGTKPHVVLAALSNMERDHKGAFAVVVLNSQLTTVGEYKDFGSVPQVVKDDFGERTIPNDSNTLLVFRKTAA